MKKNELIPAVAASSGLSQDVVRRCLDTTADVVRETLGEGGDVFLFGLGKLEISRRGPKKARNLRTGEAVIVPERCVAVYRPSSSVDDAVNGRARAEG